MSLRGRGRSSPARRAGRPGCCGSRRRRAHRRHDRAPRRHARPDARRAALRAGAGGDHLERAGPARRPAAGRLLRRPNCRHEPPRRAGRTAALHRSLVGCRCETPHYAGRRRSRGRSRKSSIAAGSRRMRVPSPSARATTVSPRGSVSGSRRPSRISCSSTAPSRPPYVV